MESINGLFVTSLMMQGSSEGAPIPGRMILIPEARVQAQ
jgi:hypothetical protein